MGMELRLSKEVAKLCTSAGLAHIMIEGASKVFSLKGGDDVEILMTAIAGESSGLGGGKMVKDGHGVQFKAGLASSSPTIQLAQKLVKVYGWTVKTDFVGKDEMDEESLNSVVTKRME